MLAGQLELEPTSVKPCNVILIDFSISNRRDSSYKAITD